MKITQLDLVNIINTLNLYGEKKLPQRISYAITKNIILTKDDYICYEKELRKIFFRHEDLLQKDADGNIICNQNNMPLVKEDVHDNEFNTEIMNLLNLELDVELYHIPSDAFDYSDDGGKYDALSPNDIIVLQRILCEDENETEGQTVE